VSNKHSSLLLEGDEKFSGFTTSPVHDVRIMPNLMYHGCHILELDVMLPVEAMLCCC
jgi:hypothetical protein